MASRESLVERVPELAAARWVVSDDLDEDSGESWNEPRLTLNDLAFLQYTSGSTASPRAWC